MDTTLQRNAMYNAYANANRKKGKKPIKLWKRKTQKRSKADYTNDIASIMAIEAKDPERNFFKNLRKGGK